MSNPRILVIEDNPGDVEILKIALNRQEEPYELVVLSDGAEALRYMEDHRQSGQGEPDPCVVLLDVHLPKYDGLEVLAALRQDPKLSHVQVIMLASAAVLPREEASILHMDAVFRTKPRTFQEVLALAAEVIELCKRGVLAG